MSGRRLLALLVALAAIGIPAGVLQAVCAGRSCEETDPARRVPFCALPEDLRDLLENGYRERRSPDVLAVARDASVYTSVAGVRGPWPGLDASADVRVPIVFAGAGVTPGADVRDGVTLDRVAPTVAEIVGFERPFPGVRSGVAIDDVASGEPPELVLLVAWKSIGAAELEGEPDAWPFLASLLRDGAGTVEGETGSLPLDPAATITTIGTGGLPAQHGITGSTIRDDDGRVVAAFGEGAPVPIIATLADDLDEAAGQRADVALVATDALDRGLIGGEWYARHDTDAVVIAHGDGAVAAARALLEDRGGSDGVTDVLGVVLDGDVGSLDRRTERIVRAARAATDGAVLVVVAGTGSPAGLRAVPDDELVAAVEEAVPGDAPAVAASVPGGLFLDQDALTSAEVTGQVAVDALLDLTDARGTALMADAFQGFAVSFARYC